MGHLSFPSAVQWWEQWQLRILVLGSLFVQFFLLFVSMVRRFAIPSWLRSCLWLAYLGGDALAIYALATLFNRHNKPTADGSGSGGSSVLEVLWAPVLLIHLAGNHKITAYSIEDNELWRRHVVTLVSQVTVALYVFCKSWSGEKRLLQAAILLFMVGIIKFIEKPWALERASINGIVTSSAVPRRRKQVIWANLCILCCTYFGHMDVSGDGEEEKEEEHDLSLEEYVRDARDSVEVTEVASDQEEAFRQRSPSDEYTYKLFVDLSAAYSRRLRSLRSFLKLDDQHAYWMLEWGLSLTFGLFYTKRKLLASVPGCCSLLLLPFLTIASVVLFATSHKDGYNKNDIKVSYILLCCTVVLDFLQLCCCPCILEPNWHDRVAQYNLVSFCARKKQPTKLIKFATLIGCKDYVSKHWYIRQTPAARRITELVLGYVEDGWKGHIRDAASYRRFNNRRGHWALRRHKELGWSLKVPFDKSVLLWHIATDLCFHHPGTSPQGQESAARCSRVMSNYMIYLLFIRPEMLMPGTRPRLFAVECDDLELLFKDIKAAPLNERALAQEIIIGRVKPSDTWGSIAKAIKLAEALMELADEEERWKVIEGVWVEMLCYSAGRCRGYLHAKCLGEGGELLTFVWLLLSHMGMETVADRHQKPEPPEEEAEKGQETTAGSWTSQSQGRAAQSEISPV